MKMRIYDVVIWLTLISAYFYIDIDKEVVKGIITGAITGGYLVLKYVKQNLHITLANQSVAVEVFNKFNL